MSFSKAKSTSCAPAVRTTRHGCLFKNSFSLFGLEPSSAMPNSHTGLISIPRGSLICSSISTAFCASSYSCSICLAAATSSCRRSSSVVTKSPYSSYPTIEFASASACAYALRSSSIYAPARCCKADIMAVKFFFTKSLSIGGEATCLLVSSPPFSSMKNAVP